MIKEISAGALIGLVSIYLAITTWIRSRRKRKDTPSKVIAKSRLEADKDG